MKLRAETLTARYASQPSAAPALDQIDLEVLPSERLLLLGANGAGKSTFIRVFSGLMRAAHGRALVDDEPAASMRARVGVVSHATFLYEELTALENVRFYAELYGVRNPVPRAAAALEQVGMGYLTSMQVGRLSRGQQQRVALARALVHEPEVLLLDEPDTGLDLAGFSMLESLITGGSHTVVVTTHNLVAGLRLATRVAVLAHGRIAYQQATASALDAEPLGRRLDELAR